MIPTIIANKNLLPGLQDFDEEIDYLPGLVMPFDVYFLKGASMELFEKEALALQKNMTDDAIEKAFQIWPEDIYDLDAKDIIEIIRHRRNHLLEYAKGFYGVLEEKELLTEPLKGSEDKTSEEIAIGCFECDSL